MANENGNTRDRLEELKEIVREIGNVNEEDSDFISEVEDLIGDNEEFEEEIRSFLEEFLKSREESRKIIEEKNKGMSQMEVWHEEVRKRNKTRHEEELKRVRAKEINKRLTILSEKKREKELEEYDVDIKEYLGEDTYKELIDKFIWNENGTLNSRDPINYDLIVQNDKYIKEHIVFNEFTNNIEVDGKNFTNNDLLTLISHFSRVYGIYNDNRVMNAISKRENLASYHPIRDIIEDKPWDKKERIDNFFQKVCNVEIKNEEDEIYYREVARMLFYGGIKRLYEPGSKFDYMLIFEGRQGTGKSTLVRLLALDDTAYSEITTIDGQEGIENVQGSWICEFAELLAMVRTRDIEAIKAFITRQYDKYRPPYARLTETIPRQSIFIGTTNDSEFLKDSTGNRRYLPVAINTNVKYFFDHLDEVKKYILGCWREAFEKYNNNTAYYTIPSEYEHIVESKRLLYTDDDPVEGIVMSYCESKEVGYEICGMEIYTKCMNGLRKNYSALDSRNIARIMKNMKNWQRCSERKQFEDYGRQRYWRKMCKDFE